MIDLGTVKPGSTLRIPFSSFDKDDGSSITMTDYAVGDILVYKDGSTTERGSTNGYTATTNFDSKTGKHLAIIDLADNSTAGFFAAGSEYLVAIDAVTIDTVTTGGWIARFRIGYVGAVLDTTISELGASSNQMVFNLTNGPSEDDALNGMWAVIHDVAHAYQCAYVVIQDYIGGPKTVILAALPVFGIAASDNFSVMGPAPLQPTTEKLKSAARSADISAGGEIGVDWANVGSPTTTVGLTNTTIATTQKVDVETIKTQAVSAAGAVTVGAFVGQATAAIGVNASGHVSRVVLVDTLTTYTGNTVQTGDAFARLGAPAGVSVSADILVIDNLVDDLESRLGTPSDLGSGATVAANLVDIEAQTDDIGAAGAGLTAVAQASVCTEARLARLDENVSAAKTLTATYDFAKGTTAMTEAYAANGAAPTPAQAIMAIHQMLMQFAISGTSLTVRKLDNATTAFVVTLDSATTPTSAVRT